MKKAVIIILIIAILVIATIGFCGCIPATGDVLEDDFQFSDRFIIIGKCQTGNLIYCELYDKNTKVMYGYMTFGSSGSLTVLVNADGTPMLYEEDKQ